MNKEKNKSIEKTRDVLEEMKVFDLSKKLGFKVIVLDEESKDKWVKIKRNKRKFDGYVTPINKIGVMMFPTKRKVEDAIMKVKKDGKIVIAIKPFAGGRIKTKEALEYVYKEIKADSCMIGVGSIKEAKENFQIALNILKNR